MIVLKFMLCFVKRKLGVILPYYYKTKSKLIMKTIKKLLAIAFFFLFTFSLNYAQNTGGISNCGTAEDPNYIPQTPTAPPCFNETQVFDNCSPLLYVKVNFHFFLDDDGNEPVTSPNQNSWSRGDAHWWAEDLIDQANEGLANNAPQAALGDDIPTSCNPVRLVLSGVYFHNNTDIRDNGMWFSEFKNYSVNDDSEINIAMVPVSYANGVANGIGKDRSLIRINPKDNRGTLVNHEIGHLLNLDHNWEADGCSDTNPITYNWDKNCNGNYNDTGDEQNARCWGLKEFIDPDGDGIYDTPDPDCNRTPPCLPHPCCDIEYIDNNIMDYGPSIPQAWTDCQIQRMLHNLNTWKCDFLEEGIGDCAPVMSFFKEALQNRSKRT